MDWFTLYIREQISQEMEKDSVDNEKIEQLISEAAIHKISEMLRHSSTDKVRITLSFVRALTGNT